jgi:peroxiredoxin
VLQRPESRDAVDYLSSFIRAAGQLLITQPALTASPGSSRGSRRSRGKTVRRSGANNRTVRHPAGVIREQMKESRYAAAEPRRLFPALSLTPPDSPALTLPDAFDGDFGIVLFFRGSWCPYCNAQLRAFQRASDALTGTGAKVAALSVDDEPTTAALIAKHGLTFPVGHSADARAIAGLTGAFVNPDPVYLQSTGFVLDPAAQVVVSVYSSGAIGRLVPEDVIGLVRYLREHATA